MKVIFGTDSTDAANGAGLAAAALARRWQASLLVAHVIDEAP